MPQALVDKVEDRRASSTRATRPSSTCRRRSSTWSCTRGPTASSIRTRSSARRSRRSARRARSRMRHRLPQFNHLFASRRVLGRLLQLPLVRGDGRRHVGRVRGGGQPVRSGDRRRHADASSWRRATPPTAPRPTGSSAAATRTSTRCSRTAASRPARRLRRPMATADRAALIRDLERRHIAPAFPRGQLTLIVAGAGIAGFLGSAALLRGGVEAMWLRYPLAVAAGYLAFLGLLPLVDRPARVGLAREWRSADRLERQRCGVHRARRRPRRTERGWWRRRSLGRRRHST